MRKLTSKEVLDQFPEAMAAMAKRDAEACERKWNGKPPTLKEMKEWQFWADDKSRLHVDDAFHPAYDDVWDVKDKEWVGSDDEYPEEFLHGD